MIIKVYFDEKFLEPFESMIYSAMLYKKMTTEIHLEVGLWGDQGQNLSPKSRNRVTKICKLLGISQIFSPLNVFTSRQFASFGKVIPLDSNLARLDFCLNATQDFLFLDVDLILQTGWDELLSFADTPQNAVISAVPDRYADQIVNERSRLEHKQNWVISKEQDDDFYFNGGVFVFHHRNWHAKLLNEELVRVLLLIEEGKIETQYGDQDILNYVTRGLKHKLPSKYNVMVTKSVGRFSINSHFIPSSDEQPCILHYAGSDKPWRFSIEDFNKIFSWSHDNSSKGYVGHLHNFYLPYFFTQNQRKIWAHNALKDNS
jgi:lipopolysaccharide biosynthesis glycosyltransferase